MTTWHIKESKDSEQPFYVVQKAENGEILNTSETFGDKQSAITNCLASGAVGLEVFDETLEQ